MAEHEQHTETSGAEGADRGRQASTPTDVPPRGWLDIAKRVKAEAKGDQVALYLHGAKSQ